VRAETFLPAGRTQWKQDGLMKLAPTTPDSVEMFDSVCVDGRRGTVIGFYAREERTVLIRLDVAGLVEVAESRVVVESSPTGDSLPPRGLAAAVAARARYNALISAVDHGTSQIAQR
jgi:hypothetical protein